MEPLSIKQKEMLVEKWDKKGFKVSSISNKNTAMNTAILLENEYNEVILKEGESVTTDIVDFKKIVMPLVRRIMPTLIANDLVAVQPMSAPVGLAYSWKYKYGTTTAGGATAGDEMGYNTVHQGYTGQSTVTPASGASGVSTGAGELFGTGGSNSEILDSGFFMDMVTVTAKTRKIKAGWSLEAMQDLQAMHGLDIEAEMTNILQYEIAAELDREIINTIHSLTTLANGNKETFTLADSDGRWQGERFRTLYTAIVKEAQKIAINTRMQAGNFLLCSPDVVTALMSLNNFLMSPVSTSPMDLGGGVAKVGEIDGLFSVYRDTFATSNYVTVGLKGADVARAGIIYSPYVPVLITKAVNPTSFHPVIGVMSRYGITSNLLGAKNYYRRLDVNFTGVL